jgi:RNA polymerase sigma-70 factor, ECF subfamily
LRLKATPPPILGARRDFIDFVSVLGRQLRKIKSSETGQHFPMHPCDFPDAPHLERFRDYLRLLSRLELASAANQSLDPSDLVQQTLLEAYQKRDQFRGQTEAERGAWLRAILARNMADAFRAQGRQKRDVARVRSLEADLETSSACLGAWLAAEQSTPSEQAMRHEQAAALATALGRLPESQREAIILHYWQGMSLSEIAIRLDRTSDAVAGLLKRGLKHLRSSLDA